MIKPLKTSSVFVNKKNGKRTAYVSNERLVQRSNDQMKRTKLRRVSKKREAQWKEYLAVRAKFLEDQQWCEIGAKGCTRKAVDVHHIKGRNGKRLLDRQWFAAVCRSLPQIYSRQSKVGQRKRLDFNLTA